MSDYNTIYPESVTQTLADGQITTDRLYSVHDFPFGTVCDKLLRYRYCGAHQTAYIGDFGTFDIETTNYQMSIIDDEPQYNAFMYHWQFCIDDKVIIGRTWGEFLSLLEGLKRYLGLSHNKRFVVYVHNLSFEFQFFRNFVSLSNVFSLERRKVVKCIVNDVFEFRCSWKLSNMGLQKFVSNTPGALYWKKSGDLDYSIQRTPSTPLTNEELAYCYNDVRGLREAIRYLLTSEHDTLATIPQTSTGYVRREFRAAINKNPANHYLFKNLRLEPFQYALLKTATRGGNCHCNPVLSGAVDDRNVFTDVGSYDMSSAYPAVMTQCKFPMSPFIKRGNEKSIIDKYIKDGTHALLIDCVFYDIKIKTLNTVPYIPKAKCTKLWEPRIDNGRVLSADFCGMVMTDIDWTIINNQYEYSHVDILNLYSAKYDYLPIELREKVIEQYTDKCKLKWGDPYLYNKYKNKINADFGMMLTDICRREISFDPTTKDNPFSLEPWNIEASMARYYNSRNSFLAYQWGVWVTAWAREALERGIRLVHETEGASFVYCDTDCVKYIGSVDWSAYNADRIAECKESGAYATDPSGVTHYMGVFETEDNKDTGYAYWQFKTLGAKKYAYVEREGEGVHCTIAGVNKKKGGKELDKHGGLSAFDEDFVFTEAGGTQAVYNDNPPMDEVVIDDHILPIVANVSILPSEYTLGITGEYERILKFSKYYLYNYLVV